MQTNDKILVFKSHFAVGKCSNHGNLHAAHLHCLDLWFKRDEICPIDNEPWEYKLITLGLDDTELNKVV